MEREKARENTETDLTIHIFSVSATLVGVCLTVIGILKISFRIARVATYSDDLLALDALLFLVSCSLAFAALRLRKRRRQQLLETIAENVFFLALALMVFVCAVIVYELL
ncbi:hypothetical protein GURASL_07490 [Geotalea uraniireducens]|uniref:Uncharacterized protein n=1 Tax=Geotalea uraniireducens TaxID=351604 RepID=A0ABM8EHV4_9BACT|nr:hypothetical protein [Geotalea uraniireducens]BDV41826.1 hypothetical protein GURASL_07490 [Geotalea uraniireducens]